MTNPSNGILSDIYVQSKSQYTIKILMLNHKLNHKLSSLLNTRLTSF